jgi:hypothetical protein
MDKTFTIDEIERAFDGFAAALKIDKDEARETWRLFVPHLISVGAGKKLAGA